MKIGFNCGHTLGGPGYGAVGALNEVTEDRAVGREVMQLLRKYGHTVIDCTVDSAKTSNSYLQKCCDIANNNKCDIFVSLHYNAGGGHGTEIFTWNGKTDPPCVMEVLNNLVNLGFTNRGIKNGNELYVIRTTKMPAMLIETCFIDNATDYELYNKAGRENVATAIAKGIANVREYEVMTYQDAIKVLINKKVINSPEYWNNAVKCVNHLEDLIINMAKALS